MLCRKNFFAGLLSLAATGFLFQANAESFVSLWSASSGLRPDQDSPYWALHNDSVTPANVSGGIMTIATGVKSHKEFFYYGQGGIEMPSNLTIEFKARFVSAVAHHTIFSPLSVYFCIGSGLGGALYLGGDDVWLAGPNQSRASGTTVDTDNSFHTYRIELTGATIGSLIKVYYDNALTPLLTSPVVHDVAVYGNSPQIGAGDNSSLDSGVSEWEYLWHNASCVPINSVPEPTSAALLVGAALLFCGGRFRKP